MDEHPAPFAFAGRLVIPLAFVIAVGGTAATFFVDSRFAYSRKLPIGRVCHATHRRGVVFCFRLLPGVARPRNSVFQSQNRTLVTWHFCCVISQTMRQFLAALAYRLTCGVR